MNAGITADVVYEDLKALLLTAALPPGARLAPHRLARRLGAGLTPIREALFRLTGERLIEMKVNDGFHLPVMTEGVLRDLYTWNEDLVRLALHYAGKAGAREVPPLNKPEAPDEIGASFLGVAEATGSSELMSQIASCNDRLYCLRLAETKVFNDWKNEAAELSAALNRAGRECLKMLHAYHSRRVRSSIEILSELRLLAEV